MNWLTKLLNLFRARRCQECGRKLEAYENFICMDCIATRASWM
jgi:NMD protein affecting ribosome stability and mRNA decay